MSDRISTCLHHSMGALELRPLWLCMTFMSGNGMSKEIQGSVTLIVLAVVDTTLLRRKWSWTRAARSALD